MRLTWDDTGKRFYETGVKQGVLYPQVDGAYPKGVAWNGLTAVTESPSGAEATPLYADDIKYLELRSNEEFGCTIEAYTYPDEFKPCNGEATLVKGVTLGQQTRTPFGFCYKTITGDGDSFNGKYDYILHFAYNATVSPSEKTHDTINDSPDAATFSWEATTDPVTAGTVTIGGSTVQLLPEGKKRTSLVTLNVGAYIEAAADALARTTRENNIATLLDFIEGTNSTDSKMPTPWQIHNIISTGL